MPWPGNWHNRLKVSRKFWLIDANNAVSHVYVAPGNGGTASGIPKVENKPIQVDHHDRLISFAKAKRINLVVPGPEAPLVNGITDILKDGNIQTMSMSSY